MQKFENPIGRSETNSLNVYSRKSLFMAVKMAGS